MADEQKKNSQEMESTVSTEEKKSSGAASAASEQTISETWAEDTIADLDEFIESQGIYIRQ